MWFHGLGFTTDQWFDHIQFLDSAVVGFGFLASVLALAVGFEFRLLLKPDLARAHYMRLRLLTLLCYVSSLLFGSIYFALAMPKTAVNSFSLGGLLLTFFSVFLVAAATTWLSNAVRDTRWLFRVVYGLACSVVVWSAHLMFLFGPLQSYEIDLNWSVIGIGATLTAMVMTAASELARRILNCQPLALEWRLAHSGLLSVVQLMSALLLFSSIDLFPKPEPLGPFWMTMSHQSFGLVTDVFSVGMVLFVVFKMYKIVEQRFLGLQHQSSSLTAEYTEQKAQMAHQAQMLTEKEKRVRDLERALAQEPVSEVSTDGLIAAMLALQEGIFEWDMEQHSLKMSPTWANLLGLDHHKLDEDCLDVLHHGLMKEEWMRTQSQVLDLMAGKIAQIEGQLRYTRPDQQLLKVDFRAVVVKNAYGLPIRVVGVLTDRTGDFDLELAMRSELNEEFALSRLKSDFVSYLSHEIRTPMTVVASANTLLDLDLRMNRVSSDNLVVYSQQIAGAMRSLRGLVDETLIFMNTEGVPSADLERSPVDVARVFRQLMQAECSRLQLDPDQCVQVEMGHSFPALGLLPERLFAQGLRHFLGFVLNEGQARQFVIREEPGLCIIEAQWTAKPHWLPEAYLTLPRPQSHLMNMPWTDLDMPFPLLMTKRVIRNFQGTLTLNRLVAQEGAGQFGLRLSVPVAWEAVC